MRLNRRSSRGQLGASAAFSDANRRRAHQPDFLPHLPLRRRWWTKMDTTFWLRNRRWTDSRLWRTTARPPPGTSARDRIPLPIDDADSNVLQGIAGSVAGARDHVMVTARFLIGTPTASLLIRMQSIQTGRRTR